MDHIIENAQSACQEVPVEILNMQDTLAKAASLNIPLSEYTLRRAIRNGDLPCRIVGRTYLIAWPNVIKWLMCADGSDNRTDVQPVRSNKIRRIG